MVRADGREALPTINTIDGTFALFSGEVVDAKQVLAAIAQLEAAGEGITCRAVQGITKGSMRDVSHYVQQWRESALLPKSDWDVLEERLDALRYRIGEDRALRRQYTHTKELVGLLLQAVRYLANHPPPTEIHHTHPVRPMTRKERSDHNKTQWAEIKGIMRLLRTRYGY
jgi:hypothetical protein